LFIYSSWEHTMVISFFTSFPERDKDRHQTYFI
jgi:hypothetical protein